MATRKRPSPRSRRSGLVDRAVRAGINALREAESRVPPDVRRQLERTIKDGQKTLKTAIDQLQVQVRRTAKQADVDKALKRLEGLSKQVQKLARDASSRGASTTRRAKTTAKRTTRTAAGTAKRAASTAKGTAGAARRTTSPRKPAARAATRPSTQASSPATARRAAPRRASTRRSSTPTPEVRHVPPAPEPEPMPQRVDSES
jgi:polyhydroxyalkanoate synthesis regulator phasin